MNPATADHRPPPQPHRPSFSCDLHPAEKFNGFCPSCLCDRLSTLHPATSSLFRRTKSFSASNHSNANFSAFEPQRRSCDVRVPIGFRPFGEKIATVEEQPGVGVLTDVGRAQALAHKVDGTRVSDKHVEPNEVESAVRVSTDAGRAQTPGHSVGGEIRAFEDPISLVEGDARIRVPIGDGRAQTIGYSVSNEIRAFEDSISPIKVESTVRVPIEAGEARALANNMGNEARFFEEEIAIEEEMKRMRDYIDLDFQAKKKKAAGFWSAASVFSKKWNKWMKKQKTKKQSSSMERTVLPLEKPISQQYRETQSEVADYGFGRRSCDTDPRFSIDIGRLSIDGPRPSFDPPRASWDGHMLRRSNYSDHRVPIVEPIPGDSVQTHQYYLDTSSRRRRSFDRSGSKMGSFVTGAEINEMMVGLNAKVTPETFDCHQRKSNSNSLRDECSEIFELGIRDDGSVIKSVEEKALKKSRRWGKRWSFWGLINRRNNYDEDDRYSTKNGFDRSASVRGNNGDIRGGTNGNIYRRTSNASLTNSYNMGGLRGSVRNQSVAENGYGRKKRDDLVLERNRSVDNGLLRFYLTSPGSNSRSAGSKKSSRTDSSRPVQRGVIRN